MSRDLLPDEDQRNLFDAAPAVLADFDGETYEEEEDQVRLTGQLLRTWSALQGGEWFTLRELSDEVVGSEASVSARLRDLRKKKFGSHVIDRERVEGGLFRYRLADEGVAE